MTALYAITGTTLPGIGATLLLLGLYAYGVRQVAAAIAPTRLSANAYAAVALCALLGAMAFLGSWSIDNG